MAVNAGQKRLGQGVGLSKKEAEQNAAKAALKRLKNSIFAK
jgi:dsRNA-specific ribonuclease